MRLLFDFIYKIKFAISSHNYLKIVIILSINSLLFFVYELNL